MQSQCPKLAGEVLSRYPALMVSTPFEDSGAEERLSKLESLLTFMQRTIDDLNQVVLEQAKRMDVQDKEMARLRASLETLIGSIVEAPRRPEDERPPHY